MNLKKLSWDKILDFLSRFSILALTISIFVNHDSLNWFVCWYGGTAAGAWLANEFYSWILKRQNKLLDEFLAHQITLLEKFNKTLKSKDNICLFFQNKYYEVTNENAKLQEKIKSYEDNNIGDVITADGMQYCSDNQLCASEMPKTSNTTGT